MNALLVMILFAASGNSAYKNGEFQKALEVWQKRAKTDESPAVQYNLGAAHYRLGQFDEARKAFERAASAKDKKLQEKSRYNAGNAAFKANDLEGAIQNYEDVLKSEKDADAEHNLSLARKLLQQQKEQKENERKEQEEEKEKKKQDQQKNQQQDQQPKEQEEKKQQQGKNDKQDKPMPNKAEQKEAPQDIPGAPFTREQAKRLLENLRETRPKAERQTGAQGPGGKNW